MFCLGKQAQRRIIMGLADLHTHTTYSWDGTSTVRAVLKHAAVHTTMDVIAITDHDEIDGALEALELAADYGVSVIPGSEISTAEGHLLALFIYERVPANLSLADTVLWVAEMGGLCIAAHPMARGPNSLSGESIRKALAVPGVPDVLVGIEAFNGGLGHRSTNGTAFNLALNLPLAPVANSDSHVAATIGQGATRFAGRNPMDVRRALVSRSTGVHIPSKQTSGLGILSLWAPRFVMRRMGLATL
jgi:predicted metal-dependent phosphoesterase TrpH